MPLQIAAVIPAGGVGRRMALSYPKQFAPLAGKPVLVHTLTAFRQAKGVGRIVLAAPAQHQEHTIRLLGQYGLSAEVEVVTGGRLRQDSVAAGLARVPAAVEVVLVHDAARPLVEPALITACAERAALEGAAMAAIPVKDTLKAVSAHRVERTVNREGLWQAQTPQAARTEWLRQAFAAAAAAGFVGTDEASLLEHCGYPVSVVPGSERNLKITSPEDLQVAEALLAAGAAGEGPAMRIGHGYDAHRLVAGRPLVLGGVVVEHHLGLLGHSDADVLTHALCDALLGALGEGDIGRHFPDSDPQYRGVESLKLLARVMEVLQQAGYGLVNADLTVVAQKPKLAPFFPAMREKLARCCRVEPSALNLKASTTEQMGFAGREEGMAAHAVVMIRKG